MTACQALATEHAQLTRLATAGVAKQQFFAHQRRAPATHQAAVHLGHAGGVSELEEHHQPRHAHAHRQQQQAQRQRGSGFKALVAVGWSASASFSAVPVGQQHDKSATRSDSEWMPSAISPCDLDSTPTTICKVSKHHVRPARLTQGAARSGRGALQGVGVCSESSTKSVRFIGGQSKGDRSTWHGHTALLQPGSAATADRGSQPLARPERSAPGVHGRDCSFGEHHIQHRQQALGAIHRHGHSGNSASRIHSPSLLA